jgi:hypothetical protein
LDKSNMIVVGGFGMKSNINGNVHVEHLTIDASKRHGVRGYSSFSYSE